MQILLPDKYVIIIRVSIPFCRCEYARVLFIFWKTTEDEAISLRLYCNYYISYLFERDVCRQTIYFRICVLVVSLELAYNIFDCRLAIINASPWVDEKSDRY